MPYPQSAALTWGYATPDAGVVAVDAGYYDIPDAADASDVVDVPDVPDVPDTGTGPSAEPEVEALARFYVLCSPVPGTPAAPAIDGGVCPPVPLPGLGVTDDAQLQRWSCSRAPLEPTARGVTIDGLPAGIPHRFGVVAEDAPGRSPSAGAASLLGLAGAAWMIRRRRRARR